MSFRIYDVPREMVTDFWSAVEPMLARALEHNPHLDTAGLLQILVSDFARLFVMTEDGKIVAACVMERVAYPSHVVANVLALGGQYGVYRKHVDEIHAHMRAWAKARKCDRIGFVGRPGWTKWVRRIRGNMLHLVHAWESV